MKEFVRSTVPKVKMHYITILCMHFDKAPCIPACPIEGAIYKRFDGMVIIDPEKCNGCKACVDSCPYNTIYFNEDFNIAQKRTSCAHLHPHSLNGKKLTATTDRFGDFWFEWLEEYNYSLKIEAKGFVIKTIEPISTEKDVNLGDIPLFK